MSLRSWLRPRPAKSAPTSAPRPRLGVQRLEAREVPTVDLVSALGVGNETSDNAATDVAVDAAGNRYVTGSFAGTLDLDPARDLPGGADVLTARGRSDAYVAKYAPDDTLVWARRMGGDAAQTGDGGSSVAVDAGGNVYVTGGFTGTGDFGPVTLTAAGSMDGFVAKLAADGTVRWANRWGATGANGAALYDLGEGIGVDAGGNVYALMAYDATGYTDDGYAVLKYTAAGRLTWTQWVAAQNGSNGDLAVTAGGSVYVAGSFFGTVDFDPGRRTYWVYSGPAVQKTGFVLKLSSAGAFGWVSPFVAQYDGVTQGSSTAMSLTLDGGGNVVVGGHYRGPVDFDPRGGTTTLPTAGGAFVAKLTGAGSLAWARGFVRDGTSIYMSASVQGLATDAVGNVYAAGGYSGNFDFDPGAGTDWRRSVRNAADTYDSGDAFVLKLDAAGTVGWVETFGAAGTDYAAAVAVDPSGLLHLTGRYEGTVDFDPDPLGTHELTNPGGAGNWNTFLLRLRPR